MACILVCSEVTKEFSSLNWPEIIYTMNFQQETQSLYSCNVRLQQFQRPAGQLLQSQLLELQAAARLSDSIPA